MLDKPRTEGPIPRAPIAETCGAPREPAKDLKSMAICAFGLGEGAEGAGARRAMRPINLERRARFARVDA